MEINWQTILIIGIASGTICGLIPLITGIVRKNSNLGIIGFVSCIISGFILGLILALPVAIVFTVMIATKKSAANASTPSEPPNNFQ